MRQLIRQKRLRLEHRVFGKEYKKIYQELKPTVIQSCHDTRQREEKNIKIKKRQHIWLTKSNSSSKKQQQLYDACKVEMLQVVGEKSSKGISCSRQFRKESRIKTEL